MLTNAADGLKDVEQLSGAQVGSGRGRENNILKAITLNSPQFRHESAPLSLTRGGKEKEKKK